jgi:site-specific recombinase XerD
MSTRKPREHDLASLFLNSDGLGNAQGSAPKQVVRHTLRHTAISHLVQAGIDLPTVRRISGHKTLQMVERYSHQDGNHIQAAMDKLEARYGVSLSSVL